MNVKLIILLSLIPVTSLNMRASQTQSQAQSADSFTTSAWWEQDSQMTQSAQSTFAEEQQAEAIPFDDLASLFGFETQSVPVAESQSQTQTPAAPSSVLGKRKNGTDDDELFFIPEADELEGEGERERKRQKMEEETQQQASTLTASVSSSSSLSASSTSSSQSISAPIFASSAQIQNTTRAQELFTIATTKQESGDYTAWFTYLNQAISEDSLYGPALHNLGFCYLNGFGTSKNINEAFNYFSKAATAHYSYAPDYAVALCDLGCCYVNGLGTQKNKPEAFNYFQKAVDISPTCGFALNNVGSCYRDGCGVAKDVNRAFTYFSEAVNNAKTDYASDRAAALCNLASCYLYGHGTQKNVQQAFQLYQQASNTNSKCAVAFHCLGLCYALGLGTQKDISQAYLCFKKAAEQGNLSTQKIMKELDAISKNQNQHINNTLPIIITKLFPILSSTTNTPSVLSPAQKKKKKAFLGPIAKEITNALFHAQGTQEKTAKKLGLSESTIHRILGKQIALRTSIKIIEAFKRARNAQQLQTDWKLDEETSKRLDDLVDGSQSTQTNTSSSSSSSSSTSSISSSSTSSLSTSSARRA